jgi:L-threonylcarbamoyladenylate synthase
MPTDTVYGLACRADHAGAVQRIFAIKQRPTHQPLALLVPRNKKPRDYLVDEDEVLRRLLQRWWPGALTVVAPTDLLLPAGLLGVDKTVGLRAPDHEWLQELLQQLPGPLAATSANKSGAPEVASISQLDPRLSSMVDLVIDSGLIADPRPSTVVVRRGMTWTILREGAIPRTLIEPLLCTGTQSFD